MFNNRWRLFLFDFQLAGPTLQKNHVAGKAKL